MTADIIPITPYVST